MFCYNGSLSQVLGTMFFEIFYAKVEAEVEVEQLLKGGAESSFAEVPRCGVDKICLFANCQF